MRQANTPLRIDLKVRIKILVAQGPIDSTGSAIRELVAEDIRSVVGQHQAGGNAPAVVGWTDVPGVRGGTQQPGVVRTPRQTVGARCRVPIVGRNSETAQRAGQERKMLEISGFEATHPATAGVDGLCHPGAGEGLTNGWWNACLRND